MPTHLFSKQKIHANRKVCMDSTFSIGGDKRDRTADLLNAIQALSQLSYTNDTQVITLLLSADGENEPDILSINGASAACVVSDLPFAEPVGAVRVTPWSAWGRSPGDSPRRRPGKAM